MLMRVVVATMLVAGGLAVAPAVGAFAHADPENCPPACDRIPDAAWISVRTVPLNSVYRWPRLAGVAGAMTGTAPRFRFEELCATPAVAQDPREYAVASRATVVHPQGEWQLQAQILHWRGDTSRGGQLAVSVFRAAVGALHDCQLRAPLQSPSITTDEPNRMAAVISGPVIMHTYLVVQPAGSTVSELSLWSTAPPRVPWPLTSDDQILDAMTAPLCTAYIASCP